MTTIAYNHKDKQIAVDSRSSRDNVIMSDHVDKSKLVNGVTFVLCGAACDYSILIDMYFGSESKLVPEANAFVIDDGKVYRIGCTADGVFWKQECEHNDALGSGWEYALAAMDFGRDAEEAVEYAKTRDCYTGGEVHVFNVESLRG